MAKNFPVVTLTGPRQSGKSTLLKSCFTDYKYISLEDPDIRQLAENDPRGFLKDCGTKCIIDEAQRVPDLFSYLQTIVDSRDECGQFILSGSHNFLLMERISQSLAGRTGILKLFPFTAEELRAVDKLPNDLDEILLKGCYPRLYDKKVSAKEYFTSYLQTYVERDVRLLRNITDMAAFKRFLKLCAASVGSILNVASLAKDAGISVITANSWISILEASFILLRLPPYYKNFSKRVIKSPKIYFCDTGLLCNLLNIFNREQLQKSGLRGAIFENFVVTEYMKNEPEILRRIEEIFRSRRHSANEHKSRLWRRRFLPRRKPEVHQLERNNPYSESLTQRTEYPSLLLFAPWPTPRPSRAQLTPWHIASPLPKLVAVHKLALKPSSMK